MKKTHSCWSGFRTMESTLEPNTHPTSSRFAWITSSIPPFSSSLCVVRIVLDFLLLRGRHVVSLHCALRHQVSLNFSSTQPRHLLRPPNSGGGDGVPTKTDCPLLSCRFHAKHQRPLDPQCLFSLSPMLFAPGAGTPRLNPALLSALRRHYLPPLPGDWSAIDLMSYQARRQPWPAVVSGATLVKQKACDGFSVTQTNSLIVDFASD
jgi:hypothetical protein